MRLRRPVYVFFWVGFVMLAAWNQSSAQVSPGPLARVHATLEGASHCLDCHGRGDNALNDNCLACHTEIAFERDAARGFHGKPARAECASCHPDHAGIEFKLIDWGEAGRPGFDHRGTGWSLDGKHAETRCRDCHKTQFQSGAVVPLIKRQDRSRSWLGLERDCSACHADPHDGRLGIECKSCHTTQDFGELLAGAFDHSRTRFALEGRHLSVKCDSCHDPAQAGVTRPLFDSCGTCHQDDPHRGTATVAGRAVDCSACHSVDGFERSTFTREDHRSSSFPLEGGHAQLECRACHRAPAASALLDLAGVQLRPAHATCTDCHADAHEGQLSATQSAGGCESCHEVQGWRPSTFDRARHAELELPLLGRHAEIECLACHAEPREFGTARVIFAALESDCVSCHDDPHRDRFPKCTDCHGWDGFRPSAVDVSRHREFDYALEGAHRVTPCNACHTELNTLSAESVLLFEQPHVSCEDCHESPHGRQFVESDNSGSCENCHGLESFRPASAFDHDRDARFALGGAHRALACETCHRQETGASDSVVIYRPLPHRCRDCHTGSIGGDS